MLDILCERNDNEYSKDLNVWVDVLSSRTLESAIIKAESKPKLKGVIEKMSDEELLKMGRTWEEKLETYEYFWENEGRKEGIEEGRKYNVPIEIW